MSTTIVIGASYAGLAAALELRHHLPANDSVIVVSASESFIFHPSLIWVVQGEREPADISFPIRPVLEKAGIEFICAQLEAIQPREKMVLLNPWQALTFDKLLIATGGEWDWDAAPGLWPKPKGHTVSILSPWDAMAARADWQALLAEPGPVVIGATIKAGLYGAAYEFALNLDIALRKAGVRDQSPITFVTPEPFLGHLGHGGLGNSRQVIAEAFAAQKISAITEAQIERVEAGAVILAGRRQRLPSKFTMLVPPFKGIKPVRDVPGLGDEQGRIPVDDYYRSVSNPDIFAAGVAIQIKPQTSTLLPCDVLIPGTFSAEMGRLAAINIAADLGHTSPIHKPVNVLKAFYVLDSGSHGLFMSLGSQSWLTVQLNVPGPWSHWAKVMAEKYQMWQIQSGRY